VTAYATATDFTTYTGQAATADTPRLLQRASDAIDAKLIGAFYAADVNGNPTGPISDRRVERGSLRAG